MAYGSMVIGIQKVGAPGRDIRVSDLAAVMGDPLRQRRHLKCPTRCAAHAVAKIRQSRIVDDETRTIGQGHLIAVQSMLPGVMTRRNARSRNPGDGRIYGPMTRGNPRPLG